MNNRFGHRLLIAPVLSVLAAVAAFSFFSQSAAAQDVFTGNPVARIVRQSSPAVVNIDTGAMVQQSVATFSTIPSSGSYLVTGSTVSPGRFQ
ncbi:MAG: hypothetical protein Q7I97_09150 [Thermovirgaceae bacterium]|nr:hypothetical protein [Thermovirgaceae bacterium]